MPNEPKSNLRENIRFYLVDCQTPLGKAIDVFIVLINLLVCVMYVVETYPVSLHTAAVLNTLEIAALIFFMVEYIARMYAARNRWKHFFEIYTVIDLVAILPMLVLVVFQWFGFELDFTFINTIRVFKVLRIFRFLRFTADPDFFFGMIQTSMLKLMRLVLTILIIFFVSSGFFFHVENPVNPLVKTFGDAFYFTVVTLTTVGFGDITPVSEKGRLVTILMVLSGIILIPWQAGQVVREWVRLSDKSNVVCSNCGLRYHDRDASHCKACGHIIYQEFESDY